MGTYAVGCWGHLRTLLHGDADHCPDPVVGALRSSARWVRPLACHWSHRGLPLVPAPQEAPRAAVSSEQMAPID